MSHRGNEPGEQENATRRLSVRAALDPTRRPLPGARPRCAGQEPERPGTAGTAASHGSSDRQARQQAPLMLAPSPLDVFCTPNGPYLPRRRGFAQMTKRRIGVVLLVWL